MLVLEKLLVSFEHLPHSAREIIAPDGSDAWAPAKPRPDETLIRALARAHRWMLEKGRYRSAAEIAEAEGVTRSFVNRLLRLTLLAPDIVGRIVEGRQPKGMQLEELTRSLPSKWEEQRVGRGMRPAAFVGATSFADSEGDA